MREKNEEPARDKKLTGKRAAMLVLVVILMPVLLLFPLPYVYKSPGRLIPASSVVKVNGGSREQKGEIYITTVLTEQANLILFMNRYFNPDSRIIPFHEYYGGKANQASSGPDPFDVQRDESIQRAKVFALQKMGYDIPLQFDGAQVTAHLSNSRARNILRPGDVVIKVDQETIKHQKDIHRYVKKMIETKKRFMVTFRRNGKDMTEEIEAVRDSRNRPSLGVFYQTYLKRVEMPVDININGAGFTGSSAGVPIFLEIIRQLRKDNLTHGNSVAATGTLNEFGHINPVHGVEYKVRGAKRAGCKYFICPAGNYKEAKEAAPGIKVIPVFNVKQAVEALENTE